MRRHLKLVAFWCGITVPSLTACFSTRVEASVSEVPGATASVDQGTYGAETQSGSLTQAQPLTQAQFLAQAQLPSPPVNLPETEQDDRFLQPAPEPIPVAPAEETPVVPADQVPTPPTPQPLPSDTTVQIPVSDIQVIGSTIFGDDDFAPIVQAAEGRSLTLEQLRGVADQITQLYLDRGYITSRAVLVDQVINQGVVQIRVVEGSLERIDIEGAERVNDSYIRSRIRLGGRTPLNQADLEDQLRLLRLDPLFDNVEASLRAGSGLGQSILTVRVTEANPLITNFSVDNFSSPSIGSERLGAGFRYLSPTGLGDEVAGSYYRSTTGGSESFDFSYRVPLNARNGTLQFRAAPNRFRVTDPQFEALDIRGNSDLYEFSYRQPLVRSPREEFALSLGFAYQNGQTFLSDLPTPFQIGPDENGVSRTSVFKFGQDYVRRDPSGAWAFRSQFSLGTDLFDATVNDAPIPDSRFFAWLGQAQRVQILNTSNLLILQADVQLTPDSLLPSQVFTIGGGTSLRGYRQNARSGDNGFRLSAEDRITIQRNESGAATLQLAPFIDAGAVWNVDDNPNPEPDETFLAGVGLGLLWQPLPRLSVRVDYAIPIIDLSDRGNNAQDEGFYFSVNLQP